MADMFELEINEPTLSAEVTSNGEESTIHVINHGKSLDNCCLKVRIPVDNVALKFILFPGAVQGET